MKKKYRIVIHRANELEICFIDFKYKWFPFVLWSLGGTIEPAKFHSKKDELYFLDQLTDTYKIKEDYKKGEYF